MRHEFGELRLGETARKNLMDVCATSWASAGPKVAAFEKGWSDLFRYRYSKAVSSGTDADINACAALYAVGANRGDEVIVPALSFIATSNSVLAAGFTPVFVDIERETLNINPHKIEEKITPKTRAIMAVSTMGKPPEIDMIRGICKRHNLIFILDNCMPGGEPIMTPSGIVNVEDIKVGDCVYSHTGKRRKVKVSFNREYDGKIYALKSYGHYRPLQLTSGHKVPCCRTTNIEKERKLEWIEVEKIKKGDYLIYPKVKRKEPLTAIDLTKYEHRTTACHKKKLFDKRFREEIQIDDNLMTILGWYLSEGWTQHSGTIFSLFKDEKNNIKQLVNSIESFGFDYSVRNAQNNTIHVRIHHKQFSEFLEDQFGKGAANKKIPDWVYDLQCDLQKNLLMAYFCGDGNKTSGRIAQYQATTVSINLANQVKMLCHQLGFFAGISITRGGVSNIQGRTVDCLDKLQIRFSTEKLNKYDRRHWSDSEYFYIRVRSNEEQHYIGRVYNFEVEEDHSYLTPGFIVKNCEGHGCQYRGVDAGKQADMSTYSFYIAHLICCGEGGMVSTDRDDLADSIVSTRSHGRPGGQLYFDHNRIGFNSKMNDMEASLGLEGIENFWKTFYTRKDNLDYMLKACLDLDLDQHAWFNKQEVHEICCPHAFSVTLKDPRFDYKRMYQYLEGKGIKCKRNFGSIPTQHKAYEFMGFSLGDFPEAEYVGDNGLHFGIHQYLNQDDLDYAIDRLQEYFKSVC